MSFDFIAGYFFGLLVAYIITWRQLRKHNKKPNEPQAEKDFSIVQKILAKNFDQPGGLN